MLRVRTGARARLLVAVGLALYSAFLVTAPFEHHDLVCHLKTPQHCTSCASSQLGSDVADVFAPGAAHLADAGAAADLTQLITGALLAVRTTGRSPPRFAL